MGLLKTAIGLGGAYAIANKVTKNLNQNQQQHYQQGPPPPPPPPPQQQGQGQYYSRADPRDGDQDQQQRALPQGGQGGHWYFVPGDAPPVYQGARGDYCDCKGCVNGNGPCQRYG